MQTIEVAIIEDQADYRNTLKLIINSTSGFNCNLAYSDGESAIIGIQKHHPDIVLVDIGLPNMSGIECIHQLKSELPKIQFMVITVSEDDDEIFAALAAGANSYILKGTMFSKIIENIIDLYNGGAPMSAQIARKVVEFLRKPTSKWKNPYEQLLTKREKEVLGLLYKGLAYKQIAGKIFISLETVKSHCHSIYQKLHVSSKIEAIRKYYFEDFN